jgi:hypothetical protein
MPKQTSPASVIAGGSAATEDVWLSRSAALAYLTEKLGRPVGVTTAVYTWGIPFHRDGRSAVYRQSVLDKFIADRREQVGQQVFGNSPRHSKPHQGALASV